MNKQTINIVGAGTLGSFTTLLLAKMLGVESKIICWDEDRVARHNMLNQLYLPEDIRRYKVDALKKTVGYLSGTKLETKRAMVGRNTKISGIVVALVDKMEARREIFEACKYRTDISLYIEARAGGNGALVYALRPPRDPDWVKRYEKTLYTDAAGIPAQCATRETLDVSWLVAASIARILMRHLGAKPQPSEFIEVVIDAADLPIVTSKVYNDWSA